MTYKCECLHNSLCKWGTALWVALPFCWSPVWSLMPAKPFLVWNNFSCVWLHTVIMLKYCFLKMYHYIFLLFMTCERPGFSLYCTPACPLCLKEHTSIQSRWGKVLLALEIKPMTNGTKRCPLAKWGMKVFPVRQGVVLRLSSFKRKMLRHPFFWNWCLFLSSAKRTFYCGVDQLLLRQISCCKKVIIK